MEQIYKNSLDLVQKFLETHTSEQIQEMMDVKGIEYDNGITIEDYFECLEDALNPAHLIQDDYSEILIDHEWDYTAPISIDLQGGLSFQKQFEIKNTSAFTTEFPGGHAA
jgi:hypothetical protein